MEYDGQCFVITNDSHYFFRHWESLASPPPLEMFPAIIQGSAHDRIMHLRSLSLRSSALSKVNHPSEGSILYPPPPYVCAPHCVRSCSSNHNIPQLSEQVSTDNCLTASGPGHRWSRYEAALSRSQHLPFPEPFMLAPVLYSIPSMTT